MFACARALNTQTLPVCSAWSCSCFWLVNSLRYIPALLGSQHTLREIVASKSFVAPLDYSGSAGLFCAINGGRLVQLHREVICDIDLRPIQARVQGCRFGTGCKCRLGNAARLVDGCKPSHQRPRSSRATPSWVG
jgi:hypothetical protein